eukprot:SAG31_NODE_1955_length_6823_cov_2.519780_6_plen_150_part_00
MTGSVNDSSLNGVYRPEPDVCDNQAAFAKQQPRRLLLWNSADQYKKWVFADALNSNTFRAEELRNDWHFDNSRRGPLEAGWITTSTEPSRNSPDTHGRVWKLDSSMRVAPLLSLVANGKAAVQKLLAEGERLAAEEETACHKDDAIVQE